MLLEICVTTLTLFCALFLMQTYKTRKGPPGPIPFPVIGNIHILGLRPHRAFMALGKKFGPIFSVYYGSQHAVVLNDKTSLKTAFAKTEFTGRPDTEFFRLRTGGKIRGVVMSEGEAWNEQREFLVKNLHDLGVGIHSMETRIQDALKGLILKFRAEKGNPINTEMAFNQALLAILWNIISGDELDQDDAEMVELSRKLKAAFSNTFSIGLCFFFPKLNKLMPGLTGFDNFMTHGQIPIFEFIRKRVISRKEVYDERPPQDLFDAYFLKMSQTVDPNSSFYGYEGEMQMCATILDLFSAGIESTSTTLTWFFLILALHPEIQMKFYAEIESVVGKSNPIRLSDRRRMTYTECLIMEVNRFASVVPIAVFHTTTMDTMLGGFEIQKGTWVTGNLYGVLHDPAVWGDPEIIRPERFLLPNGNIDRYHSAYLPFLTGKRRCPGETLAQNELFLYVTSFCQAFWIETNPLLKTPNLDSRPGMTLSPQPHSLIFRARE